MPTLYDSFITMLQMQLKIAPEELFAAPGDDDFLFSHLTDLFEVATSPEMDERVRDRATALRKWYMEKLGYSEL